MSLVAEVERVIHATTRGSVGLLRVECREGEIVLYGRCPSFACKKLVQESVMPLLGDSELVNAIEVG